MVKTCIMPHNMKDLFKTYREMHLQEVKQKEVDSLKKLSKDMQSVLKGYQKIARMGDKEISNVKYNKDYEAVLKARDVILQLIGKVNTQKILNKEETTVDLDLTEKFNPKKELSSIKKLDKVLESAYKDMNKLQYGKSSYMMKVNDGIIESRRALSKYQAAVENGELDD